MKKLSRWHLINRNRKRFLQEIERRRVRRQKRVHIHNRIPQESVVKSQNIQYETEPVPKIFDLFKNSEDCIDFFSVLQESLIRSEGVHIKMSDVEEIDASALIFLLSILKNLRHRKVKFHFRGDFPSNLELSKKLENTGFLNYMDGKHKSFEKTDKTLMIKEGASIDGNTAKLLCDFIRLNLNGYDTREIYTMLIELMENTVHHAYDDKLYFHNWYVYCECEEVNKRRMIKIVFFDNGIGIPSTVYKTKIESFKSWLSDNVVNNNADVNVLEAAFDGAFKTRTKMSNRGKGLPFVNDLNVGNKIQNLKIITNKAFFSKIEKKDLKKSLQGTLYSWEVF